MKFTDDLRQLKNENEENYELLRDNYRELGIYLREYSTSIAKTGNFRSFMQNDKPDEVSETFDIPGYEDIKTFLETLNEIDALREHRFFINPRYLPESFDEETYEELLEDINFVEQVDREIDSEPDFVEFKAEPEYIDQRKIDSF